MSEFVAGEVIEEAAREFVGKLGRYNRLLLSRNLQNLAHSSDAVKAILSALAEYAHEERVSGS